MSILDRHKPKDQIDQEIIAEKQVETGVRHIGTLSPQRGQRIYELDEETLIVREVKPYKNTETIHYEESIEGKTRRPSKGLTLRQGCRYVCKINMKNALKFFGSHYSDEVRAAGPDDARPEYNE